MSDPTVKGEFQNDPSVLQDQALNPTEQETVNFKQQSQQEDIPPVTEDGGIVAAGPLGPPMPEN